MNKTSKKTKQFKSESNIFKNSIKTKTQSQFEINPLDNKSNKLLSNKIKGENANNNLTSKLKNSKDQQNINIKMKTEKDNICTSTQDENQNNQNCKNATKNLELLTINEKKEEEPQDNTLITFLNNRNISSRRCAICSRLDKLNCKKQLSNYMEYLLREDYIKNFLL